MVLLNEGKEGACFLLFFLGLIGNDGTEGGSSGRDGILLVGNGKKISFVV